MAPRRRRHEETGLKVVRLPTDMSRADPLWLFFFTGRSRVKGQRGAPMLLALPCVFTCAQASCRLQSEAPRAVVRGTFICGTTRNYKLILNIVLFVRESLKYAAAFLTSFMFIVPLLFLKFNPFDFLSHLAD